MSGFARRSPMFIGTGSPERRDIYGKVIYMAKQISVKRKRMRSLSSVKPASDRDMIFDYKDPRTLAKFVMENGAIAGRDKTNLSNKAQRSLAQAIKRARHLALLPFTQTLK